MKNRLNTYFPKSEKRYDPLNRRDYFDWVAQINPSDSPKGKLNQPYTPEQIAASYFILTEGNVREMDLNYISLNLSKIFERKIGLHDIETLVIDKKPLIQKLKERNYDHVIRDCKGILRNSKRYNPFKLPITLRKANKIKKRGLLKKDKTE